MAVAYVPRMQTFWISHWSGDQEHYIALAMKLDRFGLDDYNLRSVTVKAENIRWNDEITLVIGEVTPDVSKGKGLLLVLKEMAGILHYDQPLYYLAPAFPATLMISNRLFNAENRYRAPARNLNNLIKSIRPPIYFTTQFYAVIIPLFFSGMLILMTFFLGRELFSTEAGFYAALMIAFNPLDILTSQRIWPADMVSALASFAILIFIIAQRKQKKSILLFCSGCVFGLAVLTRQNIAVMAIPVCLTPLLLRAASPHPAHMLKLIFSKDNFLFIAGAVIVSYFWFAKTYEVFGAPVHIPEAAAVSVQTQKISFLKVIMERPPLPIFYLIGIPSLSPIFILAYASFTSAYKGIVSFGSNDRRNRHVLLLWGLILSMALYFIIFLPDNKEHRYMLPVYPMIAILAGYVLSQIKPLFQKHFGPNHTVLPQVIVYGCIIGSAIWSIPIGIDAAVMNKAVILYPF